MRAGLKTHRVQGRGKKDAKQLAAATLLEELLGTVDSTEFLLPSKQPKHLPLRVSCAVMPGCTLAHAWQPLHTASSSSTSLCRSSIHTLHLGQLCCAPSPACIADHTVCWSVQAAKSCCLAQQQVPFPGTRLAPRGLSRVPVPRGRQAFMQGLQRGSQLAYAAGMPA